MTREGRSTIRYFQTADGWRKSKKERRIGFAIARENRELKSESDWLFFESQEPCTDNQWPPLVR